MKYVDENRLLFVPLFQFVVLCNADKEAIPLLEAPRRFGEVEALDGCS
jgi:hypothetical protein